MTMKKSSTQMTKIFDGFVGSFKGASIGMLSAPGRGSRGLWSAVCGWVFLLRVVLLEDVFTLQLYSLGLLRKVQAAEIVNH